KDISPAPDTSAGPSGSSSTIAASAWDSAAPAALAVRPSASADSVAVYLDSAARRGSSTTDRTGTSTVSAPIGSLRPAYSSTASPPNPIQRPRSPVRYIREPGSPNGFATNRVAVNPARPG